MSKDFNLPTSDIIFSALLERYEEDSCDSDEVKILKIYLNSFKKNEFYSFIALDRKYSR